MLVLVVVPTGLMPDHETLRVKAGSPEIGRSGHGCEVAGSKAVLSRAELRPEMVKSDGPAAMKQALPHTKFESQVSTSTSVSRVVVDGPTAGFATVVVSVTVTLRFETVAVQHTK